jgi:uncharacterized spore protein YtfJ
MADDGITQALSKLDAIKDIMAVRRVFGEAYELDGASIIPVAAVRGAGGGGGGGATDPQTDAAGSGLGVGFAVDARPVGVLVVKDGEVTWRPTFDVMRIVLGAGQLLGVALFLAWRRGLLRRLRFWR